MNGRHQHNKRLRCSHILYFIRTENGRRFNCIKNTLLFGIQKQRKVIAQHFNALKCLCINYKKHFSLNGCDSWKKPLLVTQQRYNVANLFSMCIVQCATRKQRQLSIVRRMACWAKDSNYTHFDQSNGSYLSCPAYCRHINCRKFSAKLKWSDFSSTWK